MYLAKKDFVIEYNSRYISDHSELVLCLESLELRNARCFLFLVLFRSSKSKERVLHSQIKGIHAPNLDLYRNKKIRLSDKISGQVSDKEDLYVRYSGSKPAMRSSSASNTEIQRTVPKMADSVIRHAENLQRAVESAAALHVSPSASSHTGNGTGGEGTRRALEHMSESSSHRFKFALERKAVVMDDEQETCSATPFPTDKNVVQAICIKCSNYMHYKADAALVSCPNCHYLQVI